MCRIAWRMMAADWQKHPWLRAVMCAVGAAFAVVWLLAVLAAELAFPGPASTGLLVFAMAGFGGGLLAGRCAGVGGPRACGGPRTDPAVEVCGVGRAGCGGTAWRGPRRAIPPGLARGSAGRRGRLRVVEVAPGPPCARDGCTRGSANARPRSRAVALDSMTSTRPH